MLYLFLRPLLSLCEDIKNKEDEFFERCRRNDFGILQDSKVKLKQLDLENWSCMHWAAEFGHLTLVLGLLEKEPLFLNMKTSQGLSAINIAAWRGDANMVKALLENGAEVDDRTQWGEAPLHHAVTFGHAEVCEVLLKAGADPNCQDRLKRTPHSIAMQHGSAKIQEIFSQASFSVA